VTELLNIDYKQKVPVSISNENGESVRRILSYTNSLNLAQNTSISCPANITRDFKILQSALSAPFAVRMFLTFGVKKDSEEWKLSVVGACIIIALMIPVAAFRIRARRIQMERDRQMQMERNRQIQLQSIAVDHRDPLLLTKS
jgi:hypothetical protein